MKKSQEIFKRKSNKGLTAHQIWGVPFNSIIYQVLDGKIIEHKVLSWQGSRNELGVGLIYYNDDPDLDEMNDNIFRFLNEAEKFAREK